MSLIKSLSKGLVANFRATSNTATPLMKAATQVHVPMLKKVAPELPRFKNVLGSMRQEDFKISGLIVNDDAQAALGEFYLALALRLHPEKIDAAGEDNNLLLKIAFETAENDFEPWLAQVREFVENYDSQVHDDVKVLQARFSNKEICEGTFWSKFLELVAEEHFIRIKEAALARESELTSHELVDKFIVETPEIQEDVAVTRERVADSVLMDFQADVRSLLADNGLLLISEELKTAMEEHKKKTLLK